MITGASSSSSREVGFLEVPVGEAAAGEPVGEAEEDGLLLFFHSSMSFKLMLLMVLRACEGKMSRQQ
jgi:hypothetical protein